MDEMQFRQRAREAGFGECEFKVFAPDLDGPLHTHEYSVMLLVMNGEFTLEFENDASTYLPGECCELAAEVRHAERTGATGARVLLGRRKPVPTAGA